MEFRLLGPLEIVDDAGAVPLAEGRQRSVLVFLLLHRNETVPSERLIDALWGERPPPTAAKVLQNQVSQLRRALDDREGERLQTRGRGYALRVGPAELDLDRFEELASAGAEALERDAPAEAAERLREALALCGARRSATWRTSRSPSRRSRAWRSAGSSCWNSASMPTSPSGGTRR
jgi:DNA-binding SARP family transcriptional activator